MAPLAASGIMAMIGRPAAPVQPQNVIGLGDSTMKRSRLVVVPLPGNRIGVVSAAGAAEAAKHVERCAAVPCGCDAHVALAVAGRPEVRAQDADCVEGAGHPQFDVAAGAGVDLGSTRRRCRCCRRRRLLACSRRGQASRRG